MPEDARDFFYGDREVDRFSLPFHGSKARLECRVVEHWHEILYHVLKCGAKLSLRVTRRLGLVRQDQVELESAVKGSLGLKGIAELAGTIKTHSTAALTLEESREDEETREFTAPKCGRLTVLVYQLVKRFELRYEDDRFLHRDKWTRTYTDWQHRFHDASKVSANDPDCECDPRPDTGADGMAYLGFNGLSMLVPYRRAQQSKGLEFPGTSIPSLKDLVEEQTVHGLTLEWLPGYLRFLAEERRTSCDALLRPYLDPEEETVFSFALPRRGPRVLEVAGDAEIETAQILREYEVFTENAATRMRALRKRIEEELQTAKKTVGRARTRLR